MTEDGLPSRGPEQPPIADPRLTARRVVSGRGSCARRRNSSRPRKRAPQTGWSWIRWHRGLIVTGIAVVMTLFHLYAAYDIVPTQQLRYIHVGFVMVLCFLLFPVAAAFRNRIRWWDVVAAAASVAILGYALWGGDDFTDRATRARRSSTSCSA